MVSPGGWTAWFMALFERDSLIASYQAVPFQAHLAQTMLEALSSMQATGMDDAEPGKILHELRYGELARLGKVPHTPYYGTHDATPLLTSTSGGLAMQPSCGAWSPRHEQP